MKCFVSFGTFAFMYFLMKVFCTENIYIKFKKKCFIFKGSAVITLKRTWFIEEFSKKINSTLTRYINTVNHKFYMQYWQLSARLF